MAQGPFDGKTILITGGGGAIGRATAKRFLDDGAKLVLVDVNAQGLEAAASDLASPDRVQTHLSYLDSVAAAEVAVEKAGDGFHALVHLAGISLPDPEDYEDLDLFDRTIAANTRNAYALARVIERRGLGDASDTFRIVLASSMAYRRGGLDRVAYSSAKGAIAGMVRALSRRLAPRVHVNGIAPGIILTPMTEPIIKRRGDDLAREIPIQRYGRPTEVAGVIAFLCGPDASYVNGQIINIDGGTINS
ncbi:SDR family oxidoreductase [Acidisoma cellulosilytica]|uniref:SDR family oxidoreductase n=1 Tax=Acidisoma cellulosilyticum TaxID=2802395 RepID=A0A963Z4M7_9PROT|nr:SDR family oxidoreductase [Acidisoma cellulosilyticum]MCB8882790.1 SDR family oxidoreductase [Acidisoma cellulosilyticum]